MHALHSFLPKNYHSCFIFLPITQADCTLPRWGCTFALSYSLAFPNFIALNLFVLNAVHWCSQKEFLENTEGAIDPLSFYMYSPVLWRNEVTRFSFWQGSGGGAAGLWSPAREHAVKAMSESSNEIRTQRRKEAGKCRNYRAIPVPGETFTRMLLRTTKKYESAVFCRWTG